MSGVVVWWWWWWVVVVVVVVVEYRVGVRGVRLSWLFFT
jgi:hypothetical protein